MSVLIKGMNIPYGCANCDFVGSPIYDSKGRAIYSCNVPVDGISGKDVTEQVIDMYEGGGGDYFPNWCPLIEIPNKHGDLIDRQKLIEDNKHLEYPTDGKYRRDRAWAVGFNAGARHCNEHAVYAKAVIEAEEEA